jgi:hypothetical protein
MVEVLLVAPNSTLKQVHLGFNDLSILPSLVAKIFEKNFI